MNEQAQALESAFRSEFPSASLEKIQALVTMVQMILGGNAHEELNLDTITITEGGHETRGSELCVAEAAAWYAGQPHSDQPITMSPEIGAFLRGLSVDIRDDATRTRLLRPLVPMIAHSAAWPDVERRRRYRAVAWLVRMYVPLWFTPALWMHGERLGGIAPITERSWPSVQPILAEAFAAAADRAGVAYRPLTQDNGIEATWDAIRAAQQVPQASEHPSFIAWRQVNAVALVQELVAL